ncbi:hypothetical protein V8B97DRAFT_2037674 [Scleroderma yunnanense]
MATEPSTSITPLNTTTPSTEHVVSNAAQVIIQYTDGLQFNNNVVYWQKAVDVVWGQLHVEAVVGDLPACFIMSTYIIAVNCFMFKLWELAVTEAMVTMELPLMDKDKGKAVDVEIEPNIEGNSSMQIRFNIAVVPYTTNLGPGDKNQGGVHAEQGWIYSCPSTQPSPTVADPTASDGFNAIDDATQCNQCATQDRVQSEAQCNTARHAWSPSQVPSQAAPLVTLTHPTSGPSKVKVAQMEWSSQKNFEVYIQLPAWMPKSKLCDASITSTIVMSAINPPTTPTSTVTTAMTYCECLEDVKEDMFLLKWDYIKMKSELDETCQEVETLQVLMESLRAHQFPTPSVLHKSTSLSVVPSPTTPLMSPPCSSPSPVPVPCPLVDEDHNPFPSPASPTGNVTSSSTIIRVSTPSVTSMVGGTDPYEEAPPLL